MIVVDIGCAAHYPGDDSIGKLVERFHPSVLYGFDPYLTLSPGDFGLNGTRVILERKAAWINDGKIGYTVTSRPSCSYTAIGTGQPVECLDLASFLSKLYARGDEIVLKLDCEGAEYMLLRYLITRGVDDKLALVLVEWHDQHSEALDRTSIEAALRCQVEAW